MRVASVVALAVLALSAAASDGLAQLVFSDGKHRSLSEFAGQSVAVQVFCKS